MNSLAEDPAKPTSSGSLAEHINLLENSPNSVIKTRKDALTWCASQGVTPMPCMWGTKKAVSAMWKKTLGEECGGFLKDHPLRREAIKRFWENDHPKKVLNISLVSGWNKLCAIDCDSLRTMKTAEKLIDAPKITSKKGGKFLFFLDGEAPTQVQYKTPAGKNELEFFSANKHVLIFGKHPEQDEQGHDIPYRLYPQNIPTLTWDQLQEILLRIATINGLSEEVKRKASKKRIESDIVSKAYAQGRGQNISDWFNLPFPEPDNAEVHGENSQGSHPVHGSTTGNNFSVNTITGEWYCYRHAGGSDRFMWLLIENHIIECEQAAGGWSGLTRSQQREANELLKTLYPERYEEYRAQAPKSGYTKKARGAIENTIESIPDGLPDHRITLLNGLARIGKTSFGVKCLLDAGQGTFIAHTHSIMENAMKMMKSLWDSQQVFNKTAVCVVGKHYACNDEERKGRCSGCPKAPKNPTEEDKPGISILLMDTISKDLLQRNRMLTKSNVPAEYCPYHALMHAHSQADFVFLVPFFSTIDDELRRVLPRKLCVIDEGPTCDHYRTPTAEICNYQRFKHGGLVTPAWEGGYEKWFATLKEFVEHRLDKEDGSPSPRRMSPVDSYIVSTLEKFLLIYDILIRFNMSPTPAGMKRATEELKTIEFKNVFSRDFKINVLKKIEDYSKEAGMSNASGEMETLFVISLYPGDAVFSWQGENPAKLFMISDNSLYILPEFEKLLVIGASQGERFVKDYALGREIDDVFKLHITGFPFSENYLFVRLSGSSEEKLRKAREKHAEIETNPVDTQKRQFAKFIRATHVRNGTRPSRHPALLITASKVKQRNYNERLLSGSSMITDHGIDDVYRDVYIPGNIGIFTQNSCISRGIDVQFFDRVFFAPGGFATPYQTARIQYLEEKIQDAQLEASRTGATTDISLMEEEIESLHLEIAEIQTDEITNNVLRSAPVRGDVTSMKRLKVCIMTDDDYQKLDYRIKNLTRSIQFNDEEDPNLLLNAMDSIHHAVTPTDLNLDRPCPYPLIKIEPDLPLPLREQHLRLSNYIDYRVSCIDRNKVPYEKIINQIVREPMLLDGKRKTKQDLVKRILVKNGTHIPEKTIKDCIALGLADRLILDEHSDGKTFYRLHPNTIAFVSGAPLRGPDFPSSLNILHPKN